MSRRPSSSPSPSHSSASSASSSPILSSRPMLSTSMTSSNATHQSLNAHLSRYRFLPLLALSTFLCTTIYAAIYYHPNPAEVSDRYRTMLTPNSPGIGAYWGVIAVALVALSAVMVAFGGRSLSTKVLLTQTISGLRFPFIMFLMALWTVFWSLQSFLLAELVLLGAMGLTASVAWSLTKFEKGERRTRRAEADRGEERVAPAIRALVAVPVKMMLVIMLSVDIWQNGLLALGYYHYVGPDGIADGSRWSSRNPVLHEAFAVGIVLGLAIVNSLAVFIYTDLVWALSAVYLSVMLAIQGAGKSGTLLSAIIFGAIAVSTSFVASIGWEMVLARRRREGRIQGVRLGDEE